MYFLKISTEEMVIFVDDSEERNFAIALMYASLLQREGELYTSYYAWRKLASSCFYTHMEGLTKRGQQEQVHYLGSRSDKTPFKEKTFGEKVLYKEIANVYRLEKREEGAFTGFNPVTKHRIYLTPANIQKKISLNPNVVSKGFEDMLEKVKYWDKS